MSNNQQQAGQSRQSVSYPSPTSYPSPSMSNAPYNYPPPNNQQVNESYRASPTGSNGAMPLPSMRSLDPMQQQQQHMGSPLPHPPVAQMGGNYYHSQSQTLPHPYPNVTSDPNGGGNMRYALPVSDPRVMSGGRHKKEIKRRTKTGCLTCRKRRIKCDEHHPACRNCQKSKRECMGYDPIFKSQPGPAAIQPAPSSAPSQGPLSATANPYGNQPQMLGGYSAAAMNYDPSLPAGVSSPGSGQHYDYASAIDPALTSGHTSAAGNQYMQSTPGMSAYYNDPKRELYGNSPYSSSGASDTLHLRGGGGGSVSPSVAYFAQDVADTISPAKRSVIDLLAMGGPIPALVSQDQNPTSIDETKHLYYSIYAPGLENFLESKWYSVKGLNKFLGDKGMMDLFGALLVQFQKSNTDPKEVFYTNSIEARVCWSLACNVRAGATEMNGAKSTGLVPPSDDPMEAARRLRVFEALLTGEVRPHNPLTQPVPGSTDHHRLRELEFWHKLGNFVCIPEDDSQKQIDDSLAALRTLLDGRENRDVLYSIAVIRAIGQRVSDYTASDMPHHFDETDDKSKLQVAKKFITDEANGNGTTNVIRRFCELATRTWSAASANASSASPVPQNES
ncbi:putative transcriptional regulatory [Hyphodiscus hymeniophilus]|uniref:Transcriptional regulatory n=1 Tax=Hyphodiscus hymeniophilus TaxID=353542 RepID=A0A9P7AYD9_9HELO|nr:putative transcriptional regulatory [Hyphodiscus hymeniophilus]